MADLKVDYDQLNASYTALRTLHQEFEDATKIVDESSDIWGDGHINDAMSDFAGNWKLHREKLLGKMEKVEDATHGCVDTFEHADAKIANGVQVHKK